MKMLYVCPFEKIHGIHNTSTKGIWPQKILNFTHGIRSAKFLKSGDEIGIFLWPNAVS